MEENDDKIRIERILGLSVTSNAHFDSDSGLIAYPAGNTVVLLDIGSGAVVSHVVLETRKSISALQLKGNSLLFVASDESNFLRVVNWQSGLVKDISPCQNVICCAVSSSLGVLVTVGSDHVVSVWDFKGLTNSNSNANTPTTRAGTPGSGNNRGRKLASSSVACKVSCVYFSPDGNYFVTGGTRHLKFWYIQLGKNECVLTGRPAILGSEHSGADFRDVITDGHATYAIANFDVTASATLCQFDERRFLDKWVQLKAKQAYCMCMDEDLIFIGCADGIIRCFRAGKLDFIATLPLPHHLGVHIAAAVDVTALSSHPPGSKFPNVVAISAPGGKKVVAVYADHSLYAWDVQDVKRVGLSHSWLWHSGCIWDISVGKPPSLNNTHSTVSTSSAFHNWPSFVTCGFDDTVRVWDITSSTKSNLYSNECIDIKYISTRYLDSPLFLSHGNGVRCVGIGSNFICCGDRQGNLRLWGSQTKNEVIKIKAHKEEILAMDVKATLVATASRDGTVNLYSISDEIDKIGSLQEHNGSVTSVKFFFSERNSVATLHVASCGADKNLVLRQLGPKTGGSEKLSTERSFLSALEEGELVGNLEVRVNSVVASKTPLFDLDTDTSGKHVLVACQDGCVRVYSVSSGKHSKTLRNPALGSQGSLPTIIKITVDPSGYYVAVAATDKTVTVFDYYKGDVMATLLGHSELATAIRFTPDLQTLLSVGGDSCIFVWTLPREMVVTMKTRMSEKKSRVAPPPIPPKPVMPLSPSPAPSSDSSSPIRGPDYRFSFGQLPDWAKKQMTGEPSGPAVRKQPAALPQGKWSERVDQASGTMTMTIKSFHNSDTVVSVPVGKLQAVPTAPIPKPFQNPAVVIRKETEVEEKNGSFEVCPESLDEILTKDDREEDVQSSDFYSDVNKSTDGELSEAPRLRPPKLLHPSDTDTDESSSTRTSRSAPSKRIIGAHKDSGPHPSEIARSRNAELIRSVKLKNKEISKSRLDLEKRLEETRKKLQSIGYKSMSQSTTDLSRGYTQVFQSLLNTHHEIPAPIDPKEARCACCGLRLSLVKLNCLPTAGLPKSRTSIATAISQAQSTLKYFSSNSQLPVAKSSDSSEASSPDPPRRHKMVQAVYPIPVRPSAPTQIEYLDDSEENVEDNVNGGVRRACSLSDLNVMSSPANSSTPSTSRRKRSFNKHRNKTRSGSTGVFDAQNIITRSTSMSALMVQLQQSDSEPESLPAQPSYMSQTKSSQGKTRRKPPTVTSAYSQENLRDEEEVRARVSASEQNIFKMSSLSKHQSPMARSKMTTPAVKKPQQVYGIPKAVVSGVRQGGWGEAVDIEAATMSVESLRKSLDQVIYLRTRVSHENVPDQEPIARILDDGLLSVHRVLQESAREPETRHKFITEHEPTVL